MVQALVDLNNIYLLYGAGGLALAWWVIRRRRRGRSARRSQRAVGTPTRLDPDFVAEQKRLAERVMATSSTAHLAGFEIVRQIEAVYVDGFRHPEEALVGLKAAAALKGGNAVIHVRHERTSVGRCTASGDAVLVRAIHPEASPDGANRSEEKP